MPFLCAITAVLLPNLSCAILTYKVIDKMSFKIVKNSKETHLAAYNHLAGQIFGLDFEPWINGGYGQNHIPYTMFDGEMAVANVSCNKMEIMCDGNAVKCIQIGTVMTHPDYRGRGLCRQLMEEVLADFTDRQCVFLFANKTVTDFYPLFGFEKADYYTFTKGIVSKKGDFYRLDMDNPADVALLKRCYNETNPFSRLQAIKDFDLLMFYCSSFMKKRVYYSPAMDAVVIMDTDGNEVTIYDIYCDKNKDIDKIVSMAVPSTATKVVFGFSPADRSDCSVEKSEEENTTLFVLKNKKNIFAGGKMCLTEISHT